MIKSVFCLAGILLLPLIAEADSILQIGSPAGKVRKELVGINQLHYRDGYGFVDTATGKVLPEMFSLTRRAGFAAQRYPGGCGSHEFNWKYGAGLGKAKPALGLVEFLKFCQKTNSTVIYTLSAKRGTPREAAELVEFLNLPAKPEYPWAMKRAEMGYPEPFSVKYFEYGNESFDGHAGRITPQKYAADYLAFRKAMKAVDPSIELGVVTADPSPLMQERWNKPVFEIIQGNFDFLIFHHYARIVNFTSETYIYNFMRQQEEYYDNIRNIVSLVKKYGVENPRMVNTEFNSDHKNIANISGALVNSEYLRMFFYTPGMFMANCWQFINEGFGVVGGRKEPYTLRPSFLMFELYGKYLLDDLFEAQVKGPVVRRNFAGKVPEDSEIKLPEKWSMTRENFFSHRQLPGNVLEISFPGGPRKNFFHAVKSFPCDPRYGYRLTCEMRCEGMPDSTGAQIEIGDARGYEKTVSCTTSLPVLTDKWTTITAEYVPLFDTSAITIKARCLGTGSAGKIAFRNLKVVPFAVEDSRGVLQVAAVVTQSSDKKKVSIIVNNLSLKPEKLTLAIPGAASASAETLSAADPKAGNEIDRNSVGIKTLPVSVGEKEVVLTLPPCSISGIVLYRK